MASRRAFEGGFRRGSWKGVSKAPSRRLQGAVGGRLLEGEEASIGWVKGFYWEGRGLPPGERALKGKRKREEGRGGGFEVGGRWCG